MINILIKPHYTEKTMAAAANSSFTFEVSPLATKSQIKQAVQAAFNVHVLKVTVRLGHIPAKSSNTRRTQTPPRRTKYATVTLKKGETIDLFEFKDN